MCLAVPAKITAIDGQNATVDIGGLTKQTNLMLTPQASIGDYVLLHAGFAISVMDSVQAAESIKLLSEMVAGEADA